MISDRLMPEHQPGRLRGVAAAALGALAFAALFVAAYAWHPMITIGMDRDPPPGVSGLYPIEHADGRTYAWTHPHVDISLPGLDRGVAWRWTARAILWRPPGVPLPTVRVAADGVVVFERTLRQDFEPLDVTLPERVGRNGLTLTIETVPSFVPGPSDSRELGIALESMSFEPVDGVPLPPRQALAGGACAVLMLGLAWTAMGLPPLWVLVAAISTAAGQAWAITHGVGAYTPYPWHLAALATGIGMGTWIVVRSIEAFRREPMSLTARGVAAFSALVCYSKLLVLVHPGMSIGDGVFHAHRFEDVLSGHLYFTSLAPGNYSFPYPVFLYVFAAPFSFFAHDTLARVALLRIVVTAADAAAGALLYWMLVRTAASRMTAAGAVVWYHLVPMTGWIMTWGNLTNAFGQTLFVASLAVVVALPVEWRERRTVAILAVLASAALLSHPSTCAILTIVLGVTTTLYAWQGSAKLRSAAVGVGVATIVAGVAAFVLYYAWFPALYVRELGRAAAESGTRIAETSPGSSISDRIASIPNMAGSYLGWPALVAAAAGAWRVRRVQRQSASGMAARRLGRNVYRVPGVWHRDADPDADALRRVSRCGDRRGVWLELGMAGTPAAPDRRRGRHGHRRLDWRRMVDRDARVMRALVRLLTLEPFERHPGRVIVTLGLVFAMVYVSALTVFPHAHGRIVDGDTIQYYAYLRSLAIDHDLDFRQRLPASLRAGERQRRRRQHLADIDDADGTPAESDVHRSGDVVGAVFLRDVPGAAAAPPVRRDGAA